MGNYLDKAGLQRAFTKLKTITDKKTNLYDMMILTSSNSRKGQYIKFAEIDLTNAVAYLSCSGTINFMQGEGTNAVGNLFFQVRNGATAGTISTRLLYWTSLSNKAYANSVSMVNDSVGKVSFYYKPVYDFETPYVNLVGCGGASYFKFVYSTSSVASITASVTSSLVALATKVDWASDVSNKPNYAGSSSKGGSATSAVKLDTATAGSATQPVYFSGGKPVATTYTLGASVPSSAKFTDTNTWRGIQNNLTSTSTTDSLSAAQGKILNDKFASYVPTSRTVNGKALSGNITLSAGDVGAAASSHTHSYLPLSGGTMTGQIVNNTGGSSWIQDRNGAPVKSGAPATSSYKAAIAQKTGRGSWSIGALNGDERLAFNYTTDTNYNAGTNSSTQVWLPTNSGTLALTSQIPSVGNGTVTIKQAGTSKGTFTMNQSGNTTIELTDSNTTYSAATTSAAGLMSAADKTKLDGIAAGANKYTYTLPTASSSTLGGVKVGSNITLSSGTISLTKANVTTALGYTPPTTNTTYSAGTGISLSGTTFSNSGVRSVATGTANGTISVNTNGSAVNVAVNGLGSAAYTNSSAYAANDVIVVSDTKPTSSTCKIWVKI